jgi:hypothetical protein
MEKFTWDDLSEAIKSLPPEQRQKQVYLSIDDESTFRRAEGLECIPEDVYVNNDDDEDSGDLETLKEAHGEDFQEENYSLRTPKGTPFLYDTL